MSQKSAGTNCRLDWRPSLGPKCHGANKSRAAIEVKKAVPYRYAINTPADSGCRTRTRDTTKSISVTISTSRGSISADVATSRKDHRLQPGSPEFAQERDNRSKKAKFIFREIGSIRATGWSPQPPPRNRVSRGRSLLGGDRPPFQTGRLFKEQLALT